MRRLVLLFPRSRWARRIQCHGDTVCCQYVDLPTCNSLRDTHRRGRLRVRAINGS